VTKIRQSSGLPVIHPERKSCVLFALGELSIFNLSRLSLTWIKRWGNEISTSQGQEQNEALYDRHNGSDLEDKGEKVVFREEGRRKNEVG
jgi:hypothetical protein